MRTISALFDSYDHAASAVRSLKDAGIPSGDISLVANNADGLIQEEGHTHSETNAPKGAGLGAATGAGRWSAGRSRRPGHPGHRASGRRWVAALDCYRRRARCDLWRDPRCSC